MSALDDSAIERALQTYRLRTPRAAMAGRIGGMTGMRGGGSLEIQDFREYQPGDDVRQLDWNAIARTGQLIVRIRREEVSPRVEVVLDCSKSMALTDRKRARAVELTILTLRLARAQGLQPSLILARERSETWKRPEEELLRGLAFDSAVPLGQAINRDGVLRQCGVRIVISDFLFETSLSALCGRLSQHAALVSFAQIVDEADLDPKVSAGATLVDSETNEHLDRVLSARVIESYKRRLATHQAELISGARRAQAQWCQCVAQDSLTDMLRTRLLGTVLELRA